MEHFSLDRFVRLGKNKFFSDMITYIYNTRNCVNFTLCVYKMGASGLFIGFEFAVEHSGLSSII